MGKAISKPVGNVVTTCYPAYASFKALEMASAQDGQQWLTYWAVYGISTSMETMCGHLFKWIPGYYVLKMALFIWMMLPKTKGALIIYEVVLRPLLKKYEPLIDKKLLAAQEKAEECIEDFQEHGHEALTRRLAVVQPSELVTRMTKALTSPTESPKTRKSSRTAKPEPIKKPEPVKRTRSSLSSGPKVK